VVVLLLDHPITVDIIRDGSRTVRTAYVDHVECDRRTNYNNFFSSSFGAPTNYSGGEVVLGVIGNKEFGTFCSCFEKQLLGIG
jgi:hypothetical protein